MVGGLDHVGVQGLGKGAHPVGWALLLLVAMGSRQAWWGEEIHHSQADPSDGVGGLGEAWDHDSFQSRACGHALDCDPLDGVYGSVGGGGGQCEVCPYVPLLQEELDSGQMRGEGKEDASSMHVCLDKIRRNL